MTKLVRMVILALSLLAILGGIVGDSRSAEAANGYEQWVGGFSDGCAYFWDGYVYTAVACPRTDGGFDFSVDGGSGQWVYVYSAGFMSDGGVWLYYQGQYYYYYDTASDTEVAAAIIGGASTVGGATPSDLGSLIFQSLNAGIHNPNALCTWVEYQGQVYCDL